MELAIHMNKNEETILLETNKRGALKKFVLEFVQNEKWKRFEFLCPQSKKLEKRLYKSLIAFGDKGLLPGCTVLYIHSDGDLDLMARVPNRLEVYKNVRKNRKKIGEGGESRNPGCSGRN